MLDTEKRRKTKNSNLNEMRVVAMSFVDDFERRRRWKKEKKWVYSSMTQTTREHDFYMKVEECLSRSSLYIFELI